MESSAIELLATKLQRASGPVLFLLPMGWRGPETAMTQCKTRGGQLQSRARHPELIRAGERNQLSHLRLLRSLTVCLNKHVLPETDPSLGYTQFWRCLFYFMFMSLAYTYAHALHGCLGPRKTRRSHQISWNQNYRWL